jgi:hypothetical protein
MAAAEWGYRSDNGMFIILFLLTKKKKKKVFSKNKG